MPVTEKEEDIGMTGFFPVTSYLKGQLADINRKGLTPLKYTTLHNQTDSTWLKPADYKEAFKEFLSPEIDSANLTPFFSEKKFMDRTLDAFTFTYDPAGPIPDSISLHHWDVYIDPSTGRVKRVYMVKQFNSNTTIQLTWMNDKWCKMTTFIELPNGISSIEKEEKIIWDFDIQ